MGYPLKHIVGFDGETYDIPEGSGGLRRLTFSWNGSAGTLTDYDTGETVTLDKNELFLFMGKNWGFNRPAINDTTAVGSGASRIPFSAKCACIPERISGSPAHWWLYLPVGKCCLAYYDASYNEIAILEDQYVVCEMSAQQISDFASYGIQYKDSGAVWTDFSPSYGYYNRSKVFLEVSSSMSGVTDFCIGATVGGQSVDSSFVITGAYYADRAVIDGGISRVYKTVGDGEDSQGCPAYKLCVTSGNTPLNINGIILEDYGSVILN